MIYVDESSRTTFAEMKPVALVEYLMQVTLDLERSVKTDRNTPEIEAFLESEFRRLCSLQDGLKAQVIRRMGAFQ